MKLTPIGSLVKKTKQLDPKKLSRDSIVYIDISSIDKESKRIIQPQRICTNDAPSRARKQVQANDVLVATVRPNLNGVAIVPPKYHDEIASTGFCVLRAKADMLDASYLFYFTQTHAFVSHLTRLSIGAGYPAVTDHDILDTEIPLPPLDEQKRIAAILSQADRLRWLRRYARELSDGYLQSVFLEMFGDPVSNPRGWEVDSFDRAIIETKNGFGQRANFNETGPIVLRIKDVGMGSIDYSEPRRMEVLLEDLDKYRLEDGDLLLVRVNGNPDLVGRAALFKRVNDVVMFSDHIIRAKLNRKVCDPAYVMHLLNSPYGRVQVRGVVITTAGQFTINRSGISSIRMPYPPLPLQQKFAQIVQKTERLRAQQRESERQGEHLFQSLLQRAFREELTQT